VATNREKFWQCPKRDGTECQCGAGNMAQKNLKIEREKRKGAKAATAATATGCRSEKEGCKVRQDLRGTG
jgi:hypothetical protein